MRVLPLNVVPVPKGTEAEREGKSGGRQEGERIKLRENVSGGEVIRCSEQNAQQSRLVTN